MYNVHTLYVLHTFIYMHVHVHHGIHWHVHHDVVMYLYVHHDGILINMSVLCSDTASGRRMYRFALSCPGASG